MTRKHFIPFADAIRLHNRMAHRRGHQPFTNSQLDTLADFCKSQNYNFDRERWLDYIAGECGPRGKKIKKEATN